MNSFVLNGDVWRVYFVNPRSPYLMDRTRTMAVATTDPDTRCVYISNRLSGEFLIRVLIHELGHCAMISFDLLSDIRRLVKPKYRVEAEEWICNFLADYGVHIFYIARNIVGSDAWMAVLNEFEKIFA